MREIVVAILLVAGVWFSLSGALGVVRMPDLYSRVQCASKAMTMGALPVLLGLVVAQGITSYEMSRAILVGFLLAVVNPAASHALVRAAYKSGIKQWPGAVRDDADERRD